MKKTGMTRPIDQLGRIVLPVEIRKSLDIKPEDRLDIEIDDNKIILKKIHEECAFCGADENLITYNGKSVCRSCAESIGRYVKEYI